MTYIYSQDLRHYIYGDKSGVEFPWTCKEQYSGFVQFSGKGKTKEEALANLLKQKENVHKIIHTPYY